MNRTYSLTSTAALFHADAWDALRALPADSLDACVTDPPYHLTSVVKRFGGENAAPALSNGATGVYKRASSGFMGKQWDGGDIAFRPEFWVEVLRVLKPGAHLVAFGASRGYHRMACAIEDAGFEIRDSLMWLYGTGFPKSHDVSKGIDKHFGAERTEFIGESKTRLQLQDHKEQSHGGWNEKERTEGGGVPLYAPATPQAAEWEGWSTALKPAFEPIVLARKPLSEGTVAANVLRWRTGALNIDACRIHVEGESTAREYVAKRTAPGATQNATGERHLSDAEYVGASKEGRWPANVCHDGSDEVTGAFPQSVAGGQVRGTETSASTDNAYGKFNKRSLVRHADGTGSAARFFYSAKASKADRAGSKHPTVKPVSLMEWLCQLVTPPGGTVLDPFAGSGTTGAAAVAKGFNAVLIEREAEYVTDILRRFGHVEAPGLVPSATADQGENISAKM